MTGYGWDYISEIEYTHGYYIELSPVHATETLRMAGLSRPGRPGRYLELGFGQGLSANIHAAATGIEIWGADINPTHAAGAQEIAVAADTGATLFDQSFAELLDRPDLPQFEMIALHGIWSWVNESARRIIIEIARRHLAPGGVFYISYNIQPGWAPYVPLRELLKLHVDRSGTRETISDRIGAALDFAQKIADSGAAYFRANPLAAERLKQMQGQPRAYLAHEYLNPVWEPMPFSEVCRWLDAAKLGFAARAALLEDIDAAHLTPEGSALLAGIADPVMRQGVRDFFLGEQFRRDYFVRGARRLPVLDHLAALRTLRVVLARRPEEIELKFQGVRGEAQLDAQVYTPVIESLAADGLRARPMSEIEATLSPRGITIIQILEAAKILVGKNDLFFAQEEAIAASATTKTRKLNRYLMQRAAASSDMAFLASPVTGGGVPVSRIEQLFLLAREEQAAAPAAWAGHAWRIFASQGQSLIKDGKPLEGEADNVAELTRQAEVLATQRLPVLVSLGIA